VMAQRSTLKWNGPKVAAAVQEGAERGVELGVEHLLQESRAVVPHEEGTLERSGTATTDGLQGAVSFDTPYAVRQHEDLTQKHNEGRQAKYLEEPLEAEAETIQEIIATEVRRSMRAAR
jgi:hypothetical protein